MLARTGRTVAALLAAVVLAGCHFAVVPPKPHASASGPASAGGTASPGATPSAVASATMANPYSYRLADAPALLVQCAVDQASLRPGSSLDWFSHGQVTVNTTDALNFSTWWTAHSKPGPYPLTFVIAGHPTHYLEFGTTWVSRDGQWVPQYTGNNDPRALRYSLSAWATWTALNGKLPAAVCGTSVTAGQLQQQVFGNSTPNPW